MKNEAFPMRKTGLSRQYRIGTSKTSASTQVLVISSFGRKTTTTRARKCTAKKIDAAKNQLHQLKVWETTHFRLIGLQKRI